MTPELTVLLFALLVACLFLACFAAVQREELRDARTMIESLKERCRLLERGKRR